MESEQATLRYGLEKQLNIKGENVFGNPNRACHYCQPTNINQVTDKGKKVRVVSNFSAATS